MMKRTLRHPQWKLILATVLVPALLASGWLLGPLPAHAATAPQPETKIAFIGDQALNGKNARAEKVLDLVKSEGSHAVVILGDFDYSMDPDRWADELKKRLDGPGPGASFPVFAIAGNHDVEDKNGDEEPDEWEKYKQKIEERLKVIPDAHCQGNLGEQYTCDFRGVRLILVSPGLLSDEKKLTSGPYIEQQLKSDHLFSICGWHYNQTLLQTYDKSDQAGWGVYEACRKGGGIVATAHAHSYARTHLMRNLQLQDESEAERAIVSKDNTLIVQPGETFVFHSGLGGAGIVPKTRTGGWWAADWSKTDTKVAHGALFCTFNISGQNNRAECYFKDIEGSVPDRFNVIAETASPSPNPPLPLPGVAEATRPDLGFLDKTPTKILHVSAPPQGSDIHGDGSSSKPFATIAHALGQLQSPQGNRKADAVYVHAGQYRERLTTPSDGLPDKPFWLMAAPGEKVLIEGDSGDKDPRTAFIKINKRYWVIAGFEIDANGAANDPDNHSKRSPALAVHFDQSWLWKSEQRDKWSFCLKAASMRAAQERP
jgi:predicted phosphodiesterase